MKYVVFYVDSLEVLDELTDEDAGKLFKAIKRYIECGEVELDGLLRAIFIPFKNQIERTNEKYKKICERNRANGRKGGRPPKKVKQKKEKPTKKKFGELKNVLLSEKEFSQLCKKLGSVTVNKMIDELGYYMGAKGVSYKRHYLTLLNWARRRKQENKNKSVCNYSF